MSENLVPCLRARPGGFPSRTEAVSESVKHAILTGALRPGQALLEADLAEQLGVSKTAVCEALKALAGSGLVAASPCKGAAVWEVNRTLARCVNDMRMLLEAVAAVWAVARERRWDEALRALNRSDQAAAAAERAPADRDFHQALYGGCGNPLLVKTLDELRDRTELVSSVARSRQRSWKQEAREHRAILTATENGEAELVCGLMHSHIGTFVARNFAERESE
ncbi:GntR family transcriptional regulator [Streptomyces sp. NPDC058441]|uniref:GntR family transcriptional regulator n=1 Tax=Streptomyces sp. NPDC058441 TaxID=3346502 RepID=UPI00365B697E